NFRSMSVSRALDEVGHLIKNYGIREIMDDSGTFPVGDWLREFCQGMIERGYQQKVRISCNMRFNAGLNRKDYLLMGKAGFRFLLYGLESVNQKTLDRINKNMKIDQIKPVLQWAKEAKLSPHITAMVSYPWETKKEAQKTLKFAKELFDQGLVDTLQATIVIPYPGTPLFKEADENGWLKTKDWEKYDMRQPVLKTEMTDEEIKDLVQGLYKSIFTPKFVVRKLKEALSDKEVFVYYVRMAFKFFSKLTDFTKEVDG
ncbi:radical SAM protein, partial [Patescibacteria group bacterium]|nr:radical SAM protein [Patescibacteria group bacterium]